MKRFLVVYNLKGKLLSMMAKNKQTKDKEYIPQKTLEFEGDTRLCKAVPDSKGHYVIKNYDEVGNLYGKNIFGKEARKVKHVLYSQGVRDINSGAFYGCTNLLGIYLREGTQIVDSYAYYKCKSVMEITLPDSLYFIGSHAFAKCKEVTHLHIPENVNVIESKAFANDKSLKDVKLPQKLTTIEYGTFMNDTSLKRIRIPDGVKKICKKAFYNCHDMTQVILGKGVEEIEKRAFGRCKRLKSVIVTSKSLTVNNNAFSHAHIDALYVPTSEVDYWKEYLKRAFEHNRPKVIGMDIELKPNEDFLTDADIKEELRENEEKEKELKRDHKNVLRDIKVKEYLMGKEEEDTLRNKETQGYKQAF